MNFNKNNHRKFKKLILTFKRIAPRLQACERIVVRVQCMHYNAGISERVPPEGNEPDAPEGRDPVPAPPVDREPDGDGEPPGELLDGNVPDGPEGEEPVPDPPVGTEPKGAGEFPGALPDGSVADGPEGEELDGADDGEPFSPDGPEFGGGESTMRFHQDIRKIFKLTIPLA